MFAAKAIFVRMKGDKKRKPFNLNHAGIVGQYGVMGKG